MTRTYNSPQQTAGTDNGLAATTCVSSIDCWAVGYYYLGGYDQTLIEQYNGTSWSIVPSDNTSPSQNNYLNSVSCDSSIDCWAAGYYYAGTQYQTLIEHYDGTSWTKFTSPNKSGTQHNYLDGISCMSSANCWAVGYYLSGSYHQTLIEQYNGTNWTIVTSPNMGSTEDNFLFGVTCTPSAECWATGYYQSGSHYQTLIEHYNGSWSLFGSANTSSTQDNYLNGVSCVSSTNCVAAGYYYNGTHNQTLAEQYNGTSWTLALPLNTSSSQDNFLNAVTCVSATNCSAAGYSSATKASSDQTLIEQYNGSSWTIVPSPNTGPSQRNDLNGIACVSSSNCWAIGDYTTTPYQTLVEQYNGSWSIPSGALVPPGGAPNQPGLSAIDGPFGWGWSSTIPGGTAAPCPPPGVGAACRTSAVVVGATGTKLVENSAKTAVTITDETSAPVTFNLMGSTWTPPTYNASTLTTSGGNWTYKRWDGYMYTFNSGGQLTSESDRNHNSTSFTYNTSGQLSMITDPSSRTLTITWSGNNISQIEDPIGQVVYYFYDASGNLKRVQDLAGNSVYYTYDSHHELLTESDKDNKTSLTQYNYLAFKVMSVTDPLPRQTTYSYSSPAPNQNVTLVSAPPVNGITHETQYTFTYGLMTAVTAGYGSSTAATTSYVYDPATLGVSEKVAPNLTATWSTLGPTGNVLATETIPAVGGTTTTAATYNSLNEPLTQTDANGNVTTSTYDSSGNLCWTLVGSSTHPCTSPPLGSISYQYMDSSNPGLPTSVTDQDGNTTTMTYDTYGDVKTSTDAAGDETSYSYDILSRKKSEVTPVGNASGCGCATTSYKYNALNEVLTVTAPSPASATGATTVKTIYTYDADGNLLTVQDPLSHYTTNTYDADSERCWTLTSSAPSSVPCSGPIPSGAMFWTYNADGQVASATDRDGNATLYNYNSLNQKTSSVDALGDTTTFTYDSMGNVLTTVSPNGNVSGCGCAPAYQTTNTYDGYNHLLTTKDPNNNTTSFTYDANGNRLTTTDAMGDITANAYDSKNQVCWTSNSTAPVTPTCSSPPSGTGITVTVYSYDNNGNVTQVKDPNGNYRTTTYNSAGKECWTYRGNSPNTCSQGQSGSTAYSYDPNGNLIQVTEPSGAIITSTYNPANKLCWTYDGASSNTCSSAPSSGNLAQYTYDADGNRLTMTDATDSTGPSSWTYNVLNQLTSYTNGAGAGVQYTPDANGNETKITYPTGLIITQAFNPANETCWTDVGTSSNACNSIPSGAINYVYDHNGNLTTEDLPNGVNNTYQYDGANNVSQISDAQGSTPIFSATYTRNADNLVASDSSQAPAVADYKYTLKLQLCYAGSGTANDCSNPPSGAYPYKYDPTGNLILDNGTTQSFNSNAGQTDELCWSIVGTPSSGACGSVPNGATTYTYNANGDRTVATPSGGSPTTYTYNDYNQLTQYQPVSGSPTSYQYDGTGLRQSKTTGTTTTSFSWSDTGSDPALLQETTSGNTTSYVYGPTGQPIEEILPSGSTYYYSRDHLGSIRALTDSSGTVQNTYTYDPYGKTTNATGTIQNNLLYAGQYFDSESTLYYLRARYYDPTTAQLMTVDPALAATAESYAYATGDPINQTDPSGLGGCFFCSLFVAAARVIVTVLTAVVRAVAHVVASRVTRIAPKLFGATPGLAAPQATSAPNAAAAAAAALAAAAAVSVQRAAQAVGENAALQRNYHTATLPTGTQSLEPRNGPPQFPNPPLGSAPGGIQVPGGSLGPTQVGVAPGGLAIAPGTPGYWVPVPPGGGDAAEPNGGPSLGKRFLNGAGEAESGAAIGEVVGPPTGCAVGGGFRN